MRNSNSLKIMVTLSICMGLPACDFTPPPGYAGPNDPISIAQYNFKQNVQDQQRAEGIASSDGIPEDQALAWAKDGFRLTGPSSWRNVGVTDPTVAMQWISVDPTFINDPEYQADYLLPPDWVQSFVQAGLTPQQVKPFLSYLYKNYNSEDYARITLSAWPYYQQGIPVDKAIYYAQNNVPLDQISDFDAKQKELQEEKVTYEQQKQNVINDQCGGSITQANITQMSPYAVQGKCFEIEEASVSQWLNQNSALVTSVIADSTSFLMAMSGNTPSGNILLDFPDSQQQTNGIGDVVVQGEAPFSYTATSGAQLTIPRAKILMYINSNFEGSN
jgi:hypothetical protein